LQSSSIIVAFSFSSKLAVKNCLSSHQKWFFLDEREREKKKIVKLNDNRKLMNSGNDVIVNEWNFFCLRRQSFNKQWECNNAALELLFEAKKDPLVGVFTFFRIHVWYFKQISGTNFSVGWLKLIN
jgi:hypothetical protein